MNKIKVKKNKLLNIREKLKLDQVQLGNMLGICGSYISIMENNRRKMSLKILKKLKQVCKDNNIKFKWDDFL